MNGRRQCAAERLGCARDGAVPADAENTAALAAAGLAAGGFRPRADEPAVPRSAPAERSPDPRRRLAHVGAPGLLRRWMAGAARLLKPRGVLTLIWPADGLDAALAKRWRRNSAPSLCCLCIHGPDKRGNSRAGAGGRGAGAAPAATDPRRSASTIPTPAVADGRSDLARRGKAWGLGT